jgi:hypothetical protein
MEIGIFPTIAGNDFFFNFLGLSGTPKSPGWSVQEMWHALKAKYDKVG